MVGYSSAHVAIFVAPTLGLFSKSDNYTLLPLDLCRQFGHIFTPLSGFLNSLPPTLSGFSAVLSIVLITGSCSGLFSFASFDFASSFSVSCYNISILSFSVSPFCKVIYSDFSFPYPFAAVA